MADKFNRSARFVVTNPAFVTTIDSKDGEGIRMQFDVLKTLRPDANTAVVTMINLSERTRDVISDVTRRTERLTVQDRNQLFLTGKKINTAPIELVYSNLGIAYVKLDAGYGNRLGQLIEGTSSKISHVKDGLDWRSEIFIGDAESALRDAFLAKSYKKGTPLVDVISDLVAAFGAVLTGPASALIANKVTSFPNAQTTLGGSFVAAGPAFAYMQEFMKLLQIEWSLQDGEILLLSKDPLEVSATLPDPPLVVTQQTGMVGPPRRLEGDGVEVLTLLEPEAKPGRRCEVRSDYIKGTYRIEQARHSGDTREGSWYSTLELSKLSVL